MKTSLIALTSTAVLLAGCAGRVVDAPSQPSTPTRTAVPSATSPAAASPSQETPIDFETQVDEQGAVVFEVTPLNLGSADEGLEFEVVMNTHSVDLSWDLAAQSILRTDDGLEVRGITWPVGNGHHYGGTLTFPSRTDTGEALLNDATVLTLVIQDTDVSERVFTWPLAP